MWFRKKAAPLLTPPEGFGREQIKIESSICTGETTIGFWDPKSKRLRYEMVVHSEDDIRKFYASYGFEPPSVS